MSLLPEAARRAVQSALEAAEFVAAAERRAAADPPPAFMSRVVDTTASQGAVLSVRGEGAVEYLVAASDSAARRLHELEVTLGEGPSTAAMDGQSPYARDEELERRWPHYGSTVRGWGVTALAAVPLRLGSGRMRGALTVVDPPEQVADNRKVETVAEAIDKTLIARPGAWGLCWFEEEDFQPTLHMASGVLVSRTGLRFDDAIALIHVHAYAEDRLVADVAADIIRGKLTLP